jgi:dolichyl-phosphate-mannose--protein O-mannosyl transferase
MPPAHSGRLLTREGLIGLGFIVLLSYFTYAHRYWEPANFFWDENYHIASAQKYLNGVYFMEQHPPLGKMLIAAGEAILDMNEADNQYVDTDYANSAFEHMSFAGYRLFPVLLALFTAPLIYLFMLVITKNPLWSTFLTFPYTFENALIVHSRGAMLEPPLLFFSAATILAFAMILQGGTTKSIRIWATLFGLSFGLALATKVTGLVLVFLVPTIALKFWPDARRFGTFIIFALAAFLVSYLAVWNIHFRLTTQVHPSLPDGGFYQTSTSARPYVEAEEGGSLSALPIMLRDALKFVNHYNAGVPRLDLCKDDENGSPFFLWPFGGRSINYRWETPDGGEYRYLYLQVNPVTWFMGLGAVLVTAALLLASLFAPILEHLPHRRELASLLLLYIVYMAVMSQIDRVMYLYHYFPPLLFSFGMLGILIADLQRIGSFALTSDRKTQLLAIGGALMVASFLVYRPLTYYLPLSNDAVGRRALLDTWELHCATCDTNSPLVIAPKPAS